MTPLRTVGGSTLDDLRRPRAGSGEPTGAIEANTPTTARLAAMQALIPVISIIRIPR
ncbi:MAG: hypothetical protein KF683_07805 [Rubrivivax sp.]|nr:hypothetical protein [Rubrivivax sp.]